MGLGPATASRVTSPGLFSFSPTFCFSKTGWIQVPESSTLRGLHVGTHPKLCSQCLACTTSYRWVFSSYFSSVFPPLSQCPRKQNGSCLSLSPQLAQANVSQPLSYCIIFYYNRTAYEYLQNLNEQLHKMFTLHSLSLACFSFLKLVTIH